MEAIYDIAVIGGGPAGTSAAITAARAGARVLLLERGSFPRHKVCGEFVSPESLGLLRSLFSDDSSETNPMLRNAVHLGSARTFIDGQVIETDIAPPAFSIPRYEMDAALWRKAQFIGVDAHQNVTVDKIREHELGKGDSRQPKFRFMLETTDRQFFARAVINASGRWSNFKAATMPIPAGPKWIGLKMHFVEPNPNTAVDLYFFKGGYCGVSSIGNGRINACAMVRADVARTLAEVFRCHPHLSERSRNWQPVPTMAEVSTAPLVFHTPSPVGDNVLLAGDAAGFIDPFVGDGISMALHSGAMAATALVTHMYEAPAAAVDYQSEYRRRLLPAFKNAARIRSLVGLPQVVRWPVIKIMKMPGMSELLLRGTRAAIARSAKN